MARLEVGALAGRAISVMAGNISLMSGNSSAASFGGECVPREAPDPCAYVKANPACTAEGLNYLRFIECPADANDGAAKAVLLVGWCAMLFVAIGTVGDAFFAPAVERIATRLRLPDDVAGATLLALGGAAPDIFTQIAALVESAEPDLRLALSESIGAGLFVATFGKALAVLVGLAWEAKRRVGDNDDGSHHPSDENVPHSQQGVAVEPFPYLRDVSAYLIMLILALIAMSSDTVSWELSSALVLSYVLYACVVCFGWGRRAVEPRLVRLAGGVAHSPARRTNGEEEEVAGEAGGGRGEGAEKGAGGGDVEMSSVGGTPRVRRGVGGGDEDDDEEVDVEMDGDEATLLPTRRFSSSAASPSPSTASPAVSSSSFIALALAIAEWARVESGLADETDGVSLGAVATAPVLLAMSSTMPRLTGHATSGGHQSAPRMSRGHLLLVCIVAPVFAMGAAGALGPLSERQPALLACGLGAWYAWAVWYTFRSGKVGAHGLDPGKSRWLTALTFFQGIVWMHLCADELVGLFQAAGRAAGVRESLLGATFMSWGASAGDLGGTLAVARRGSTRMAVTASLAGPLCQLSAGTGFAMWLVTARGGTIEAALAPNVKFLAVYGVAAMAFFGGVVSTAYGFVFTRRVACYVMGSYVGAVAVYVALALRSGT